MSSTQDEWPVPPPFMWSCEDCAELLQQLGDARTYPSLFGDEYARAQLLLSVHLAAGHRDAIPEPHAGCWRCDHYERHGDTDIALEHRSRDLFMPASLARML